MSTYLELCSSLRQESTDAGSGPSAVTGQVGELARFVQWIADYYTELQQERDWTWLRKSFTVSAVADDGAFAYTDCTDTVSLVAIARFSDWYVDTFTSYLTSAGVGTERELQWLDWEDFRRIYRFGTQTNSAPIHISVDPLQQFVLGPKPNATYTVNGDYQLGPQILAANGDTPEMPSRFHKLIVYGALLKYGFNRVAPEAIQRASLEGGRLRAALDRAQLPKIIIGRSLA